MFRRESVAENLRRGVIFGDLSRPGRLLSIARLRAAGRAAAARVEEVLEFAGLTGVAGAIAGELPYGLQKIVGVAMAVATRPTLMLMDEPAAGLNTAEKVAMGDLVLRLRASRGITVVLVEHDMKMVMRVCDRILVLNYGQVLGLGTPVEIRNDPAVIGAYLGAEHEFA